MNMFDMQADGLPRLRNRFGNRKQVRVAHTIKGQEKQGAELLLTYIQINIQKAGLVDTGKYLKSWHITHQRDSTKVSTSHPAARRHEYGFTGADSLGRLYDQPPHSHVRPAVMQVRRTIAENIVKAIIMEDQSD